MTTHLLPSPIQRLTQRPTLVHVLCYSSSHLNFDMFSFPSVLFDPHACCVSSLPYIASTGCPSNYSYFNNYKTCELHVALPRIKGTSDCCFKASEENGNRLTSGLRKSKSYRILFGASLKTSSIGCQDWCFNDYG